jgi:hypothetical protein
MGSVKLGKVLEKLNSIQDVVGAEVDVYMEEENERVFLPVDSISIEDEQGRLRSPHVVLGA